MLVGDGCIISNSGVIQRFPNIDEQLNLALVWNPHVRPEIVERMKCVRSRFPRLRMINSTHFSDDKIYIEEQFRKVFGYSLKVNPETHQGLAVMKSRKNAQHDGRIINCPYALEPEYAYEKLIDNCVKGDLVEDRRVVIVGYKAVFCYLKYRRNTKRFSNKNIFARVVSIHDVFSIDEIVKISNYSRQIGLELGELDILRDNATMKIYIVDANNTPFGPPNHIEESHGEIAVRWLASAFITEYCSAD